MDGRRVVITGMGIISPSGNDVATFWDNIVAGKCSIVPLKDFEDTGLPVYVAGVVKDFDPAEYGISLK